MDVEVLGLRSSPESMTVTLLNSTLALDENSFDEPYKASHVFVLREGCLLGCCLDVLIVLLTV